MRHERRHRWAPAILAAVAFASWGLGTPEPQPEPASASRVDLGRAYLRLERRLAEAPPSDEARRDANRRFDGLTMLFFAGRFGPAIGSLAELEADLRGLEGDARARFMTIATGRWRIEPPVADAASMPMLRLRREVLATLEREGNREAPLESIPFGLVAPSGESWPLRLAEDGTLEWSERQPAPTAGRWQLQAILPDGHGGIEVATLDLLSQPIAQRREALERRLAAAETAAHPQDLDLVRSRLTLLDAERAGSTASLLIGAEELLDEAEAEVAAIEAGRRAHDGLVGDRWRTISLAGARMPTRVFVPESVRAAGEAAPLLVVLHGAGGDEHMFFDGYGAGLIKRLAEERRFVVASPLTTIFATGGFLEPLIEEIAAIAPIDRGRVHLVGHSMGAGAVSRIASLQRERIASVAMIAGNAGFDPRRPSPPALVVAGEFDPLAPPVRVQPAVEAAVRQGFEARFEVIPGSGHTLVVAESLPMVVEWLLSTPPR